MKARALALVFTSAILLGAILEPATVRGVSSTVVISEFRVRGPNGGSDEFVELHNLSSSPQSIGGMLIRGSNASGTISTRATIPGGVILQPGCYYLATNSSTSGGPYSGSVPGNITYGTGITDDGGIALTLSNGTTIVDAVGLSAGSAYKEGTPLASLGSSNLNRSYERKPGGTAGNGTDTDNNAGDFQLITPSNPQNASSTCITAGPTNPSGTGTATPSTVAAGDTPLLKVTVTPGTNPTSTGIAVTGDLAALGGSATQQFFDDGVQGGDTIPGDNIFSFRPTVGAGLTPGPVNLPITITDAQSRTANASISMTIVPPLMAIHDIQGNGDTSPFAGQFVRTQGIVTALKSNGYFLQAPDVEADGDPNTSEGIFVFTAIAPGVARGARAEVVGVTQEFIPSADPFSPPMTEITTAVTTTISSGNPLPTAVHLTAADTNPAGPLDQLEKYEGMRVQADSITTTSPTLGSVTESSATGSSSGVFYGVITGIARPFREAGIHILDPLPAGSPCCVTRWDANPELLRFDSDGQTGAARIDLTSGATLTDVLGVLDFGFRTYTILPDPDAPPTVTGIVTATGVPVPGRNEFTVASMNLERFFDTVNDPSVSDVVLTPTAFANRLNKVSLAVRNLMNLPDVIGVEEMENLTTLQALADKINNDVVAGGGANPNYVAYLEEGNDIGGIDVGFLVKSTRVAVNSVTQIGKNDTYINPNNGLPEILNDRPPLVLDAVILSSTGPNLPVTVIVNHLRSLNGVEDPVDGNRVRTKRATQAEFLANLVQQRQTANPNEEIVLVGDFNAFQFSDGYVDLIGTIVGQPTPATDVVLASPDLVNPDLFNLVLQPAPEQQYSYVFDGNAQILDHVLVTGNLYARLSRFAFVRNNADFPEVYRNDANRSERYSDHDHPVAYFALPPITVTIDIKPGDSVNSINLGSNGNVPVAIFSTPDFDAGQIDPATVTLAGAGVRLKGKGTLQVSLEDVNGDGLRDLVIHVATSALQLTNGSTKAVLEGMTYDGKFIRGSDVVNIVP